MIFLVAYDRRRQALLQPVEYFDVERRDEARQRRLDVQRALPPEEDRFEVVLLEAASLDVIKQTHARYFLSMDELIGSAQLELVRAGKQSRDQEGSV